MRRLSPTAMALCFFIVFDALVFYAAYLNHRNDYMPITLTAAAPDVVWTAFDGSTHHLNELKGHVVVLHFWASWCPPCREEFPKLLKAAADDPSTMFLTISADEDRAKAEQFIKMAPAVHGLKTPKNVFYAWDPEKTITYDQFLTTRYPETIIIDPKLHMRRKFPVPVDWDGTAIRAYLKELAIEH
jgi:thiol-disulfide isomerase/thioredoxin